ncbi:MAG TPA: adenylate/guanylate cyclase domain-containing protein [Vitreimonas sp.]|nr:adenylate/guanylate cyclase domain-containing protein [Vitreimonas sp.]
MAAPAIDDATHARLSQSAPAPLVDKMRAARVTGERKPVTALFADVVGSTALAERMDPEDWTSMMNEAFDQMSKAVFHYEGTIAQLQGDAMLAFFGAPVAHEDDPERAILAALDMIEVTDEFAAQLKSTYGTEFRIRAGINTGPVVVGNVGTDLRYEYTALGDAVNVAARMQTSAEPGTVLITANTLRLAAGSFDVEDLGPLEVKGKTEPVHAYRVVGRRASPESRRGLGSVGLESPMVGRQAQLDTLVSLLGIARARRGRIAFITAEPGIGKSRLLAEFRRAAVAGGTLPGGGKAADTDGGKAADPASPAVTWIEGRCVSYGRNLPYHLLIDLVRSALGLTFGVSDADGRARLDRQLDALLGEEAADTAPYLAHLLSLPLHPEESGRATLDPQIMQGRYVASFHRMLRAMSEARPVVVVAEDCHWADAASIDAIEDFLPLAAQLPVVFIGTMRPETDSAGWALVVRAREGFGEALTELRLDPLTAEESRDLVGNLLAVESLPAHVRELILARAEGNPFFVEEVVRMLIERGVLEQREGRWIATSAVDSIEIPDTLHGLLLARIDQLPEDVRRTLRVASVIGRQFPVRVLAAIVIEGQE